MRREVSGGEWMRWYVYYARRAQREELAMRRRGRR